MHPIITGLKKSLEYFVELYKAISDEKPKLDIIPKKADYYILEGIEDALTLTRYPCLKDIVKSVNNVRKSKNLPAIDQGPISKIMTKLATYGIIFKIDLKGDPLKVDTRHQTVYILNPEILSVFKVINNIFRELNDMQGVNFKHILHHLIWCIRKDIIDLDKREIIDYNATSTGLQKTINLDIKCLENCSNLDDCKETIYDSLVRIILDYLKPGYDLVQFDIHKFITIQEDELSGICHVKIEIRHTGIKKKKGKNNNMQLQMLLK